MSDKILNWRQEWILSFFQFGQWYAVSEVAGFLPDKVSLPTLRRDISELRERGFLKQSGHLKSARYSLTDFGMLFAPIDAHSYNAIEVDKRSGNTGFNFLLFGSLPADIFSENEFEKLTLVTREFMKKSKGASPVIRQKELERFVIELSWKSSKIEGNTYTLLDTERLLKDGVEAPGHPKDEAIMILNHKKAFQYILKHFRDYKAMSVRLIEDVHRILVTEMGVSFGLRSRQVGITGSSYTPLSVPSQIREALEDLCGAIERAKNPYAKALLALLGISYIQPFEDGNKRAARLLANGILIAYDCAPLSYRSVDEVRYRESMLVFYEKNSLVPMRDIFMEQYLFACQHYLKFVSQS